MDSSPTSAAPRHESGQAIVEAAFMLPMMIFFILCTLQLTLLQQARIVVEYAAFNAARAGVVHNMNNGTNGADISGTMRNAAVYSVLPTYGRTDSIGALTATGVKFEVEALLMNGLGVPLVKVAVLNPHKKDFATWGSQLNGKEIDFDDMRPAAASATLLSIQVRYLYEMTVPFANKMIESIWFATQLNTLRFWTGSNMVSPTLGTSTGPGAVDLDIQGGVALGIIKDGMPGGLNVSALSLLADTGHFFMPLDAYYTMRMQSNPYLQWAAP